LFVTLFAGLYHSIELTDYLVGFVQIH